MSTALVIEDDSYLRSTVCRILQGSGFKTIESEEAADALTRARGSRPDLILCDISLGDSNGFSALTALRADPDLDDIPVIIMTGDSNRETMRHSMDLGADDFLAKPFTPETLLSAVQARLKAHAANQRKSEESRARLLTVLEATPDFVATASADGALLDVNQAGLAMLGANADSRLSGLTFASIRPDAINRVPTAETIAIAKSKGVWRGESHFRCCDGRIITVSQIIVAHQASSGSVDFLSTTARDMTESQRRDETLHLLERAVESTANGIAITDASRPGNPIIYCNSALMIDTGLSRAEIVDRSLPFLDTLNADHEGSSAIQKAFDQGCECRAVVKCLAKNGASFWSEIWLSPVKDSEGRLAHFIAVENDITQRKNAEHERRLLEAQLREAQKLEAIGQLAAGIAHEINTPTQFIGDNIRFMRDSFEAMAKLAGSFRGLLNSAKNGPIDPTLIASVDSEVQASDLDYLLAEMPQAIQQTVEGVERVARIVRAMKEFSHPGGSEKTPADLNRAIETTVTVARNVWKYVADLDLDLDATLTPIPCFPGELNQVLLNLIVNAAQAIGEAVDAGRYVKGRIAISSRRCGDRVEIRIGDNGSGISDKIRRRIFEPHFTTKPIGKGTGQGLALARSVVVEMHGGAIRFESEEGSGTTFIIDLPTQPS